VVGKKNRLNFVDYIFKVTILRVSSNLATSEQDMTKWTNRRTSS